MKGLSRKAPVSSFLSWSLCRYMMPTIKLQGLMAVYRIIRERYCEGESGHGLSLSKLAMGQLLRQRTGEDEDARRVTSSTRPKSSTSRSWFAASV